MSNTYCMGIDPAKATFSVHLLAPEGKSLRLPSDYTADRSGYNALSEKLRSCLNKDDMLFVGVEATCSLDDNLLAHFQKPEQPCRITLFRLDAAQVKHFSGAHPVRGKTDKADALRIARFLQTYASELDRFEHDPQVAAHCRLLAERKAMVDDLSALKNQLQDRLIISFPEITSVYSDVCVPQALALLAEAPTAPALARKRVDTIAAIKAPAPRSHRIGKPKAEQLLGFARTSIASATTPSDAATIKRMVSRMQSLLEMIDQVETDLEAYAASDADINTAPGQIAHLQSIKGIGPIASATVVLRSRGLRRFKSAKALSAQLATCPDRFQTGSSKDSGRLTHRGDRRARPTLYMATNAACRDNPVFAFHKDRFIAKGQTPKQAICTCMNRMARLMWTLVKKETRYNFGKAVNDTKKAHPDLWITFLKEHPKHALTVEKLLKENAKEGLT